MFKSILNATLLILIAAPVFAQEAKLLEVLKSDAKQYEKTEACRKLSQIGTKEAVGALASLLTDEKLSHMARYALEPITDPSVDDALMGALDKVKGTQLSGVIGSLGFRKCARAVEPLAKYLKSEDAVVASAAARSIGSIATPAAADALKTSMPKEPGTLRMAFCEGLFRCAEGSKDKAKAAELYDNILKLEKTPHQVRAAALRGAVLSRGEKGIPLLLETVKGDDFAMVQAAFRAAMEMKGSEVVKALSGELGKLSVDKQIVLCQMLSERGDKAAMPAILELAKKGDDKARLAAINAVPGINCASAIPVLSELQKESNKDIASAATSAMSALSGKEVDDALMVMLQKDDTATKLAAIELIGARRAKNAASALLKTAADSDATVRMKSLAVLNDLAGASEFPGMIKLLLNAKSDSEIRSLERGLTVICDREGKPEAMASQLLAAIEKASPEAKLAILQVLRSTGSPKALDAVRAATQNGDAAFTSKAVSILCSWPTIEAMDDILKLARSSSDSKVKILAVRGAINLIPQQKEAADSKLALQQEMFKLAERDEEKKLAVSALGSIPSAEALTIAVKHLENPKFREEAAIAAVEIGSKLGSKATGVKAAMQKVSKATRNRGTARRARDLMKKK